MKKLSVIFPYYREENQTLYDGINKISKFLDTHKINYEIIISQNGGGIQLKRPNSLTKVVFDKQRGLGVAIKNSLVKASGDYFYFLSLEVPFNLTDLTQILKINYSHYDFIIGSKLHPKSIYKINVTRKLVSSFLALLTRHLLPGFNIADPNGTLFGKLNKLKTICKYVKSDDFFFSTEMIGLAIMHGYRMKEVPVTYIKNNKTSSVKIIDGIKFLLQLINLSMKCRSISSINFFL